MAYKVSDAISGALYQQVTSFSPRGQAASVSYGNGVTTSYSFHPAAGWLQGSTTSGATGTIQSYNYGFDAVANVTSRSVSAAVGLSGTAAMSENYSYDANGKQKKHGA